MQYYDFQILKGSGWANGINDSGEVVGVSFQTDGSQRGVWWRPADYGKPQFTSVPELFKVNNAGFAIGPNWVIDINNESSVAPFPEQFLAFDVNNANQVLGSAYDSGATDFLKSAIFDWATPSFLIRISPLSGQDFDIPGGINNLGDVVGYSGEQGFLYSESQMNGVGACLLTDINDNRLAVGTGPNDSVPIYIDLSEFDPKNPKEFPPTLMEIALPTSGTDNLATAVNSSGMVVGFVAKQAAFSGYAFVYQVGERAAADLNDLIVANSGWRLVNAFDINGAGQIVGTAVSSVGGHVAGYVATPRNVPNVASLTATWVSIITGVLQDGGGIVLPGGPVPPWGPEAWISLPLDQREALVSFAISNLSNLLNDAQARTQIQRIAGDVALNSLTQAKLADGAALRQTLEEQMMKARRRVLRVRERQ
jgi:uncharacterized membrane protein